MVHFKIVFKRVYVMAQTLGGIALPVLFKFPDLFLGFLCDFMESGQRSFLGEHDLRCRGDTHFVHRLYGALALDINASYTLHLIIEHLNSESSLLCFRKNVYDTAANLEFSLALNLVCMLIPHLYELLSEFSQIENISHGDISLMRTVGFQRQTGIHASVNCSDDSNGISVRQTPDNAEPLAGDRISVNVRAEKDQIARRIIYHVTIIQTHILDQLSSARLIVGDNQGVTGPA